MNYLNKIKQFIVAHKTTSIIALVIIILIGYWSYGKITSTTGETRYVTTKVAKGTIISSVSGSGQIESLNQVEVKPSVSGTITRINVAPGDQARAGNTLFVIDNTDAQKTVRDAKVNLESAQLSLQKLQIQNSTTNTDASLVKAYSDGFNAVSDTFLDLPSTLTGLDNLLNQNSLSDNSARSSGKTAQNYRALAETAYYGVEKSYEKNKQNFSVLDYNSRQDDIDNLISETLNTTKLLANTIKKLNDYVNYLSADSEKASDYTSYQNTLSQYTSATNGHLTSLLSAQISIKNSKDALPNNGLDLQSALITVSQRKNSLADAEQDLLDYYIKAPFDGIIASVPVQKGDNATSGTVLGTIITAKQVATISLNEVDVAKISLGQKATLTFDAIPDLTITGKVAQIDSVGTVSQGVVNYNVKITLDTSDTRIKPGMSVSSAIITNMKQDVLMVPNGAVKSQNRSSYVETFPFALSAPTKGVQGSPSPTFPNKNTVEVGISNDTMTEIISGLKEGDIIVTKTITGTTTKTSPPSLFNAVGGNKAGAGASAARALRD